MPMSVPVALFSVSGLPLADAGLPVLEVTLLIAFATALRSLVLITLAETFTAELLDPKSAKETVPTPMPVSVAVVLAVAVTLVCAEAELIEAAIAEAESPALMVTAEL